jgi:hypothetical protein
VFAMVEVELLSLEESVHDPCSKCGSTFHEDADRVMNGNGSNDKYEKPKRYV